MTEVKQYPTRPLELWPKAKELRLKYYKKYADPNNFRWAGSTWAYDAIPAGFGRDVVKNAGEPYGASIAFAGLATEFQEATEAKGWARDLCAYMRSYWGGMYLDKFAFGGRYPKPDFCWTGHICCSHAKWYQHVSEYEKVPFFAVDSGSGPWLDMKGKEHRIQYVANQLLEGIEYLEKATGRKFDDELFFEACRNEFRSTSVWAKTCVLNQAVPAPLDEKTMHALYVFGTLDKCDKEFADFYDELYEEVKDRVANGIAAVANERCRLITDTQPPWAFLSLYRYLEKFGALSVGNLYTFGLCGIWEHEPDGGLTPAVTPMEKGIELKSREQAAYLLAEWNLKRPEWQHFYDPQLKTNMQIKMAQDWKLDGVILHFNRGCEGLSVGIAENRLGLMKAGYPVMAYEGNMGDEREFDEVRTLARIDAFMESMGFNKLKN